MDFLDPKKRRAYNIRLFIGFILIAIAIVLATTILALITAGYTINRKTGQVVQDSLVYINSQPVSANLYVNGVNNGTTNARLDLSAGSYNFSLSQPGYHTWSNTISLYGGQVEQLNYPFLFPTKPNKTTVQTTPSQPNIATATPDRHWLLVSVPGQLGSFYVIDITNTKTPITTITIPSSVLGSEPGTNTLSVVQWSTDNQHLILEDTYQGGTQFLMLDRVTPSNSINLTKLFPTASFTSVKTDNGAYNKLYLFNQTTGSLVLADTGAKTLTNILSGVLAYWPYGTNQILYTTNDSKDKTKVEANLWNSNTAQSNTLRTLPVGTTYELNMASYSGNLYVVIGSSSSSYAYVYQNPSSYFSSNPSGQPVPFTLLVVSGNPENVTFSDSARFISLQSGSQFAIYDILYDAHYRYDTGLAFQPNQLAAWMDGNRLDAVINGKLYIWDFDGTNQVSFTNANSEFLAAFNRDYTAVYTVLPTTTTTSGQWQVTRNSLIANKP